MNTVKQFFLLTLVFLGGCITIEKPAESTYAPTMPAHDITVPSGNGAIYQAGYDVQLLLDTKARKVGDLLTILLVEQTNATKSSSTSTTKETTTENQGPTILGRPVTEDGIPILNNTIDGSHEFAGGADSSQSNSLTGNITVTVVKRFANGNLLVRGEKWVKINQGEEFVQLSGIVRVVDINPDNTVTSDRVADARISYGGKGNIHNANRMGLFARFFNSPWMPF